jgi:hypothetical protein
MALRGRVFRHMRIENPGTSPTVLEHSENFRFLRLSFLDFVVGELNLNTGILGDISYTVYAASRQPTKRYDALELVTKIPRVAHLINRLRPWQPHRITRRSSIPSLGSCGRSAHSHAEAPPCPGLPRGRLGSSVEPEPIMVSSGPSNFRGGLVSAGSTSVHLFGTKHRSRVALSY